MRGRGTALPLLLGALLALLAGCTEEPVDEEAYQELQAWASSVVALHDPVVDDLQAVLEDPEVPQLQATRNLSAVERALEAREPMADSREIRSWTIRPPRTDGPDVLEGEEFDEVVTDLEDSLEALRTVAERLRDAPDRDDPQLVAEVVDALEQAQEARTRYRVTLFGEGQGAP